MAKTGEDGHFQFLQVAKLWKANGKVKLSGLLSDGIMVITGSHDDITSVVPRRRLLLMENTKKRSEKSPDYHLVLVEDQDQ